MKLKSEILLSLILSSSVACTSTPDEAQSENVQPEADVPASVAAKPESDVKEKADGNDVAAAVDAKLEEKAKEAPAAVAAPAAEAVAVPAPAEVQAPAVSAEKLVYPTASLVNVRQGPGKSHAVVRVAKFGEAVSVSGEQKNTWLKTTDGLWISSLFTAESKPAVANDPVVQEAPAAEAAAPKVEETVAEPVAPAGAEAPSTP